MNWAAIVWLVLMVILILIETSTVSLVSIWFATGALIALVASLLGAQVWLQITLFFVVSVVFF
jgi:membrane protein implicated in regulation of membrane protease activity